jgi:hypothetical protein
MLLYSVNVSLDLYVCDSVPLLIIPSCTSRIIFLLPEAQALAFHSGCICCLLGKHYTTLVMPPALFALVIIGDRVSFFAQTGLDHNPLILSFPSS